MESILDTDLYVLTQAQAVKEWYEDTEVTFTFIDRNQTIIEDVETYTKLIHDSLEELFSLKTKPSEIDYLVSLGYFNDYFLDFVEDYRFKPGGLHFSVSNGRPFFEVEGTWLDKIFWEVPLLAINTKAYLHNTPADIKKHYHNLLAKRGQMQNLKFCEFGTRRRRNFEYQDLAVELLKEAPGFLGTSNPYLAMKHNVRCVGTMAHQWIMAASAAPKRGVKKANSDALYLWMHTYEGKLGVALTDTYGTDNFLENFDGVLARVYDGVRQDSGSPVVFADKMTHHYESLGIDPASKTMYFSDGLTPLKAVDLDNKLTTPAKRVYCIGTDFTNDQKLNLVMKLTKVDGVDVVKISDEPGKATGKAEAVADARKILGV